MMAAVEKITPAPSVTNMLTGLANTRAVPLVAVTALALALCLPHSAAAQTPTQSYLHNTSQDIEHEDPRVNSIIARAEEHFKLGKFNLDEKKWRAAREEFDAAVNEILESGMDVRSNPRLQRYYKELVERIYRLETPLKAGQLQQSSTISDPAKQGQAAPQIGFVEQKFEPLPLDSLGIQTSETAKEAKAASPGLVVKNIPPNYSGNNAANVYSAILRIKPNISKSKFETTPEYLERLDKLLSQVRVDGTKTADGYLTFVLVPQEDYDADTRVYTLKVETNYGAPSALYLEKAPEGISLSDHSVRSVTLGNTAKTLGSAVGRTAFGVRKRYSIRSYSSLKLILPAAKASSWSSGLTIPEISPAKARQLMGRVRVAIRGRLAFPFISDEYSHDTATVSEPEESHYRNYYIYFEPDAIYAFDRLTGEALGAADLNHQPLDKYGFRISSSLTLTKPAGSSGP
jgi:hypothetical protein